MMELIAWLLLLAAGMMIAKWIDKDVEHLEEENRGGFGSTGRD